MTADKAMTDAGIPMGREQQAREVLADHLRPINKGAAWNVLEGKDDAYWSPILEALLAFADTPPPAAAGDRGGMVLVPRERLERLKYRLTLDLGSSLRVTRSGAAHEIDAILALRTPEPNSGGEADHG